MTPGRKIPFLTFTIRPYRKVKINLSGCNFDCKGCFAIAKQETGRTFSVEGLLDLLIKSCQFVYGEMVDDVQMTGGEPTISRDYLISLIKKLRNLNIKRIGISTNGHLLDKNLIEELKFLDVNYIKLDIKAYTDKIHRGYTGESNTNALRAVEFLYKYGLNFYVRTILIPELVDVNEVKKIGKFLRRISRNIVYKIYQFSPDLANNVALRRRPDEEKMLKAFNTAKRYLDNAEFYTTNTAYKPEPYKCVEIRADGLLEDFKKIDEISKSIIKDWDTQYFTMSQILNS